MDGYSHRAPSLLHPHPPRASEVLDAGEPSLLPSCLQVAQHTRQLRSAAQPSCWWSCGYMHLNHLYLYFLLRWL